MCSVLAGDDICAQRALLPKVIAKVEMGPTGGKLFYTFPLHELTGTHAMDPRDLRGSYCRHFGEAATLMLTSHHK